MAALAAQVIILGVLLICFLGAKALLARFSIVPIVGFIFLGWLFRLSDQHFSFIPDAMPSSLFLMAKIGIVFLLFHIWLESHLKRMLHFVGQAGFIALINILFSGTLGFLAAQAFHFSMATSLFIGVALTATSIGVSTASWKGKDLNHKKEGNILLDLVTIDDIVGIFLMALLFSLVPLGMNNHSFGVEIGFFFLKIVLFVGFCYLFSLFAEPRLMKELIKYEKMPDSMISILGVTLIIAGIAALIHFSLAIGAFFAGIAFSRDPKAVRMDAAMQSFFDFFVPFFFFWIGFQTSIESLAGIWPFFITLFIVAVAGKFLGTWLPARWIHLSRLSALIIAVSMIPRAEIAMVIMEHGLELGVISTQIYSAMALTAFLTCLLTPLSLKLINRTQTPSRS